MLPQSYLIPCVRAVRELTEQYGCTAVLATATQSSLDRYFAPLTAREITANPPELYAALRRATIRVLPEALDDDALVECLVEHRQVLCIVNTRRQAQALFAKLRQRHGGSVFHLSTTMYPAHRSRVLATIRERLNQGLDCRVVSTSLIEAGVDMDFPAVYRAEAGLDSIVQAAGRCNRNGLLPPQDAIVCVFTPAEHKPPDSLRANIAAYAQTTRRLGDLASLGAIGAYFEQLFYNKGDDALDQKAIISAFNSGLNSFSFPFREVAGLVRLIEDDTRSLFVLTEAPGLERRLRGGERSRELFRALGPYSVSLRDYELRERLRRGEVERLDDEAQILLFYDEDYGVALTPQDGIGLFA
jgi:CRISPR-associated endonuclease/helicase Cas3